MRQRSGAKPHSDSSVSTVFWSWSVALASFNLLSNAWPSLTGNQGSVPERVHTNPLSLLKRSFKGQDLWTGVTGIIFNHKGQSNLWLKFSCQKSILLIVSRVSLERSCFILAQLLETTSLPKEKKAGQKGWEEPTARQSPWECPGNNSGRGISVTCKEGLTRDLFLVCREDTVGAALSIMAPFVHRLIKGWSFPSHTDPANSTITVKLGVLGDGHISPERELSPVPEKRCIPGQRDAFKAAKLNLESMNSSLQLYFWFNNMHSIADVNLMKFHFQN